MWTVLPDVSKIIYWIERDGTSSMKEYNKDLKPMKIGVKNLAYIRLFD